jgi:hypothetical protein
MAVSVLTCVPVSFFTPPARHPVSEPVMVYYVALPFVRVDGGLAPGEAVKCPYEAAAIRRAQAMACSEAIAGAVAFFRRGSPDLGEFEEAVILKTFGEVPDDFHCA